MSEKISILRAFNTHFFEFLDDLIGIFPENMDIQSSKTSFDLVKRANPTAIIKAWYSHIYCPYNEIIEAGDIRFFFDKNYEEDLSILSNASEIMQIIDTLRGPIKSMSDNNQAISMKYIQNLSKLSLLYSQF
jgi:hypothetical protein